MFEAMESCDDCALLRHDRHNHSLVIEKSWVTWWCYVVDRVGVPSLITCVARLPRSKPPRYSECLARRMLGEKNDASLLNSRALYVLLKIEKAIIIVHRVEKFLLLPVPVKDIQKRKKKPLSILAGDEKDMSTTVVAMCDSSSGVTTIAGKRLFINIRPSGAKERRIQVHILHHWTIVIAVRLGCRDC
jgi:hypothetical protein